jgi:hypothetical protein
LEATSVLSKKYAHSQTSSLESFDILRNLGEAYWGLAEVHSISGDKDLAKLYYHSARDVLHNILLDDKGRQRERDAFKSIEMYQEVKEFYSDIAEVKRTARETRESRRKGKENTLGRSVRTQMTPVGGARSTLRMTTSPTRCY